MGVNWSMLTQCYPCDEGLTNIMLYDFLHNQVVLYNRSPPIKPRGDQTKVERDLLGPWTGNMRVEREENEICLHPCPLVIFSYIVNYMLLFPNNNQ